MAGSIPSDLIFRGGDGDECDEFVLAVNQWAFENDKDEDDRWVARLASSCLAGDAMRFYDTLDEEVQKSWRLLRRALFTRYSSSGANAPSPAAAVLRPFSETGPGDFRTGMIRVTVQGETKQRYLSHAVENSGSHCPFVAKKDVSAALHVKLRRSLDLQPIRIMNHAAWLGLVWYKPQASRAPVQEAFARFACFRDNVIAPCRIWNGPGGWMIWKYNPLTGSLDACWYEDVEGRISQRALETAFELKSGYIRPFSSVSGFFSDNDETWKPARLEFLPV